MIVAPETVDEEARLQALWKYEILDTGAEAVFDEIVELASQLLNVPIALISLVDRDRQWFKAKVGLDAGETSRDLAFCAHAIHDDKPLIVEDALQDIRFCDNPLVVGEPGIRFYAGAPLRTPAGARIGTLCAIDVKPRTLSAQQIRMLQLLSAHAVSMMELRIHYRDSLQLAAELSSSKKQILEMAEHNRRFLANLNHEMRTPLNAILGFSSRLAQRLAKVEVPGFVLEGVREIEIASKQLGLLINDVLSISKLDAGKLRRSDAPFNPVTLLDEVMLVSNERAKQHRISLDLNVLTELPELVTGDAGKLSQVLMNVISNAVKYTHSDKTVSVNVSYADASLKVEVIDEGVGIAPEYLEKIFDEFEQIDNPLSDRVEGTGLGLAIVKRLIDLLNGTIVVESTVGEGSKFSMCFPLPNAKNQ